MTWLSLFHVAPARFALPVTVFRQLPVLLRSVSISQAGADPAHLVEQGCEDVDTGKVAGTFTLDTSDQFETPKPPEGGQVLGSEAGRLDGGLRRGTCAEADGVDDLALGVSCD